MDLVFSECGQFGRSFVALITNWQRERELVRGKMSEGEALRDQIVRNFMREMAKWTEAEEGRFEIEINYTVNKRRLVEDPKHGVNSGCLD